MRLIILRSEMACSIFYFTAIRLLSNTATCTIRITESCSSPLERSM